MTPALLVVSRKSEKASVHDDLPTKRKLDYIRNIDGRREGPA